MCLGFDPCGIATLIQMITLFSVCIFFGGYVIKWILIAIDLGHWPSLWFLISSPAFIEMNGLHFIYGLCLFVTLVFLAFLLKCCLNECRGNRRRRRRDEIDDDEDGQVLLNCDPESLNCEWGREEDGDQCTICGRFLAAIFIATALSGVIIVIRKLLFIPIPMFSLSNSLSSDSILIHIYDFDFMDLIIWGCCLCGSFVLFTCCI
jgi:hypothetical protein